VTDSWHKALEEGSDVCAVFLDLSKAFDKVPHRQFMDKLASLHVDPYVLRWLSATYSFKDINNIRAWFMANYMMLNIDKCMYLVISRKRFPIQPMFLPSISNIPLEKVSTFKYFGVWISDDLKWTKHIEQITKKATKQAGLIYRRFYPHSSSETLKQLRPHLECAVPVWNPHCKLHITALERVQKFALKIAYKILGR